jgi:hypothetical protein
VIAFVDKLRDAVVDSVAGDRFELLARQQDNRDTRVGTGAVQRAGKLDPGFIRQLVVDDNHIKVIRFEAFSRLTCRSDGC